MALERNYNRIVWR